MTTLLRSVKDSRPVVPRSRRAGGTGTAGSELARAMPLYRAVVLKYPNREITMRIGIGLGTLILIILIVVFLF